jgi:putative N6-adenine-specific DNA methylase
MLRTVQDTMIAAAFCAVGAEKVVSNELKKLGLSVLDTGFGRVRFTADLAGLYRALMGLRVADRVLLELSRFPAQDFDALFEGVRAISWEDLVPGDMGLRVTKVRTSRSRLQAVASVQAVVHKAAAGRLCEKNKLDRLPEQEVAEIRVYIEKDQASLLLDISGDPLFKRGYRAEGGIAPLRETTAAALLFLSNWRRKYILCDPFCGSGTIAIEAALYAWNLAPGLARDFSLSKLLMGDPEIERAVREECFRRIDLSRTVRIYGSDTDTQAVSFAAANLQRVFTQTRERAAALGIDLALDIDPANPALPQFRTLTMRQVRSPAGDGFIITDPPYGRRLGNAESAEALYQEMGAFGFPGWRLCFITDHPGFESFFGRKAESCRELTNGALRSYFFQFSPLGRRS